MSEMTERIERRYNEMHAHLDAIGEIVDEVAGKLVEINAIEARDTRGREGGLADALFAVCALRLSNENMKHVAGLPTYDNAGDALREAEKRIESLKIKPRGTAAITSFGSKKIKTPKERVRRNEDGQVEVFVENKWLQVLHKDGDMIAIIEGVITEAVGDMKKDIAKEIKDNWMDDSGQLQPLVNIILTGHTT